MSTLSKSNFEAQRNINLVFRREKTVGVYASVVTLANEKLITLPVVCVKIKSLSLKIIDFSSGVPRERELYLVITVRHYRLWPRFFVDSNFRLRSAWEKVCVK